MTKKIMITGSCGFIGSNFARFLLKNSKDYRITSIDCVESPITIHNVYTNKSHQFYLANVLDKSIIDNIFAIERPDIIVHAAAQTSDENTATLYNNNVIGTENLINVSKKYNIEKFVFLSIDQVYGQFDADNSEAWSEKSGPNPQNNYALSKLAGELIVKSSELKYNILRICNNFGPRQNPRNFVPKIIKCILTDQKIPIHGNGQNIREWIYVVDTCAAIHKIIESDRTNEIYNIGTGFETSNLELVNLICNIAKKGHDLISFVEDKKNNAFRSALSSEKLKSLYWMPENGFKAALEETYSWYQRNQWYFK